MGEPLPPAPLERPVRRRSSGAIAALAAVVVALAVAGLVVWRLLPDAPPAPPLPPPDPSVSRPASLESALPTAERQARAWRPDARVLLASEQVDWPWDVPPGETTIVPGTGWIDYVLIAPWQAPGRGPGAATLSLTIERLSAQIVAQSVQPWETAPPLPAAAPAPAIASDQAILAAERAGGTDYRRACPDQRHMSRISLVAASPAWPRHWLVTYQDTHEPELNGMLVRIDAATGAVLATKQPVPTCGE
ncbi:MAG TPA: hypothetical protein VFI22_02105 [Thermomicrobiales bacterium]|nr:hypothetical protein [Thermomicrobiales bacterium]